MPSPMSVKSRPRQSRPAARIVAAVIAVAATVLAVTACGASVSGSPQPNAAAVTSAATTTTAESTTTRDTPTTSDDESTTSRPSRPSEPTDLTELTDVTIPTDLTDLSDLTIPTDIPGFSGECAAVSVAYLAVVFAPLAALDSSGTYDAAELEKALNELNASAEIPAELAPDFQALTQLAQEANGKSIEEAGNLFSSEQFTGPSDNISKWVEANCGG